MSLGSLWETLAGNDLMGVPWSELVAKLAFVAVVAGCALVLQRMLVSVTRRALERAKVPSASFIVNLLRGVVWSFALLVVLEPVFGMQPTAFVTALGVGSVALSLGMQDTLSNIIGGLALMVTKAIEPGDVIRFGDFTGTVTDINWRSTCVADAYGQVNIIPNSVISKTAVVKLSAATRSCCILPLVVAHGSDLAQAQADLERVAAEALGEWADASRDVWLTVLSMDAGGMAAQASVPIMSGVSLDHVRTRLAGALSELDWVRKP